MKCYPGKKIVGVFFWAVLTSVFALPAYAEGPIEITPGTPVRDGRSVWTLYLQGMAIDVGIDVKKGQSAIEKSLDLLTEIDRIQRLTPGGPQLWDSWRRNTND